MRTPFNLTKLNFVDTTLPRSQCREIVKFKLNQDDPADRATLEEIASWLTSEVPPGAWRRDTNALRNCWSFGFADPVLAVQFKLTFG